MSKYGSIVIGLIAVAALVVSLTGSKATQPSVSVADNVITNNEIRIGYIVYPPLLSKDPSTGQLSGISYDLIEAAAQKLSLKTNWVEEVGWGSALEGLKTKRYDMLGTQMWPNSARAREAVFSAAPMDSVLYAYVKSGDKRFSDDLSKLNSDQYTIGAVDGELAVFIAKEDYPKAKVNMLPQLASYSESFLNIVNGKADVVFVEPSAANDFLKSNSGTIERASENPVRRYGLSFAFARGEESMASMWNVAVSEMVKDGTVARTLAKYNASNDYSLNR